MPASFIRRSLLSGLIAVGAAAAAAEKDFFSLSLEELGSIKVPVVVGASKHEQKITEAPSAVSIVTQDDIRHFGYRTLGEVLESVRGFYVTSDRIYNYTGLRGVNRPGDFGGRVLINIDGHRLNEPIYDSAFTGTDFLLDLDLVERVEVIRGPGSSLYGNNAFFTVINVVTRRGRDLGGAQAAATAASLDTQSGRLTYGRRFDNGLDVLVSATRLDGAGHKRFYFEEYAATHGGVAERLDRTQATSAFAAVGYGDLRFSGGFIDRRKQNPTAQYGSIFNDPRALNLDVRSYAELTFAHAFARDWSVQSRLYYDYYRYESGFSYDTGAARPVVNADLAIAAWLGGEVLATKNLGERTRLTAGGEFRDDFRLDLSNFDEAPRATYLDVRRRAASHAFYVQAESQLAPALALNAGVRHDRLGAGRSSTNPRGALNWRPWREGNLKLLYGQAFRTPNLYERDYIQPSYKANPRLGPERVRSYECVLEQGLPGGLRAGLSAFSSEISGLVTQVLDPADDLNTFANLGAVQSRGFGAELEGRWARGASGRLSYTFSRARDTVTGRPLDNSPRHLGKAQFALPFWRGKIFAGAEVQAMSRRTTGGGAVLGPVWLANLTLYSRALAPGLDVSAGLHNIFDRAYRDPVSPDFAPIDSVPRDGRTWRLQATKRF